MAQPNEDYYRACEGSWRCVLDLRITDRPAFRRCRIGWLNRLRVLSIVLCPSWLGRFYLETTVAPESGSETPAVVHTTCVSWLGLSLLRSTEVIELNPDGRSFVLRGNHTMWPTFWKEERFVAPGKVDETGSRASYVFTWFGTEMKQSTVADGDLVVITQVTEWSKGVQNLRRA
jgi:hypothetical protein